MQLEVWSDIACPWCYIGKRRLESALSAFESADSVEVVWRSFELDPGAPAERPGELVALLARKYRIPVEQAREAQQALTVTAAGEGLEFHLARTRSGSTFDGHRLVHLAAEYGLAAAMKERLLRAYFNEGRLISDPETLCAVGQEVGVPEELIVALLGGDRFAAEVRADEQTAAELGIASVPTFILDRRVGVSGAQPPELLLELLRRGTAHPG